MEPRAKSDEDKQRKQRLILQATLKLFKRERRLHTVAKIAEEAKLAKGTLYLYFSTKEEIYMELLVSSFKCWHETVRNYILDFKPTEQQLIEFMCRSLAEFTVFVELVSKASILLEENLSVEYVKSARTRMRQESLRSCQLIARCYPQWNEEDSLRRLRRFYVYAIAYWKECFPSAQVVAALPEEFSSEAQQLLKYIAEILEMNRMIWSLSAGKEDI